MKYLVRKKRVQSVLTEELEEALLSTLRSGIPRDRVADAVGVDRETLKEWIDIGSARGAPEPFRSFAVRWKALEAAMMGAVMAAYGRFALQDWRASDAFLRLRFDEFNPEKKDLPESKPTSHEEDLEQFRQVLQNPEEFGLADEFSKHYVSREEATKLQEELANLKKELEKNKEKPREKANEKNKTNSRKVRPGR